MQFPPALQIIIAAGVAWLLALYFPIFLFSGFAAMIVAIVSAIAGTAFLIIALKLFSKNDTTINPLDPTKAQNLVVEGVYRITRNPMYLGLALLLVAWCFYLGAVGAFLAIPLFVFTMNELQIKREERALIEKFGEEYRTYTQQVRRWI